MSSLWNAPLVRDTLPEDVKRRSSLRAPPRHSLVKALTERSVQCQPPQSSVSSTTSTLGKTAQSVESFGSASSNLDGHQAPLGRGALPTRPVRASGARRRQ
ncbi:hypothetical protein PINS_up022455 [Pythium insidiosum]|nr:hypothetical protein PINS_up022455 [Pythium insidiosum]